MKVFTVFKCTGDDFCHLIFSGKMDGDEGGFLGVAGGRFRGGGVAIYLRRWPAMMERELRIL